jgi:transcriptional regulator with GAF, ATPase, and Fis domain
MVDKTLGQNQPRDSAPATLEHLGVVGNSAAMSKVFSTIGKISRYKANVLLLGESGSGKELIARALHARGPRRKHLFVPINCATLGRDLLENELFGHERGAFTGAHEKKRGLFELADGGTLFLDEIGELDPSTQAKLLRVLERNAFRRVGGTALVSVDLSVVAATNRNLEEAIAAKRFREDLYYRLKVVTIVVPPVRERREDIPALVEAFIADFNRRNGGKIRGIEPQAMRWLTELAWPGNVRELKNAVESAAMLATSETLGLEEFESTTALRRPSAVTPRTGAPTSATVPPDSIVVSTKATLADVERAVISEHMKRAATKVAAARTLGIGLRTLYSKAKRYRIGVKV